MKHYFSPSKLILPILAFIGAIALYLLDSHLLILLAYLAFMVLTYISDCKKEADAAAQKEFDIQRMIKIRHYINELEAENSELKSVTITKTINIK